MNNKRWYDSDATLSLAISLIRNANNTLRSRCAEMIILKAVDNNIEISNTLPERFNMVLRRWYDEDEKLSEALEYIKYSPIELQKEFSIDIIEFLEKAESSLI